jgi:hypothetical protein
VADDHPGRASDDRAKDRALCGRAVGIPDCASNNSAARRSDDSTFFLVVERRAGVERNDGSREGGEGSM